MRARTPDTGRGARAAWAAVLGAALLSMLVASGVFAARPQFGVSVSKTGNPAAVPASGGTVTYSYAVTATGTSFFRAVHVTDDSCSVDSTSFTGDDGNGRLDPGETWTYHCDQLVTPPHTNHVVVNACHDGSISECNNVNHSAQASDSYTVLVLPPPPTPTPSPTPTPTPAPTQAPTATPTHAPTQAPPGPTPKPTAVPTQAPAAATPTPSASPSASP